MMFNTIDKRVSRRNIASPGCLKTYFLGTGLVGQGVGLVGQGVGLGSGLGLGGNGEKGGRCGGKRHRNFIRCRGQHATQ